MTAKQNALIQKLFDTLPKDEKPAFEAVVTFLTDLGYVPQKQKVQGFDLAFKHQVHNRIIAKIGVQKQNGWLRIKFFACKHVPEKYIQALHDEAVANENRYSMPVPPPDRKPMPAGVIMKTCTLRCPTCSGGGMRYFYTFPDGREIFRCGAYPVPLANVQTTDLDELNRLLLEQHHYFLSLT